MKDLESEIDGRRDSYIVYLTNMHTTNTTNAIDTPRDCDYAE